MGAYLTLECPVVGVGWSGEVGVASWGDVGVVLLTLLHPFTIFMSLNYVQRGKKIVVFLKFGENFGLIFILVVFFF